MKFGPTVLVVVVLFTARYQPTTLLSCLSDADDWTFIRQLVFKDADSSSNAIKSGHEERVKIDNLEDCADCESDERPSGHGQHPSTGPEPVDASLANHRAFKCNTPWHSLCS